MKEPDANGVRTRRVAAGVEQAGLTGNFEPESRVDVRPGGAQPNHQAGLVPGALGPDANTGLFGTAAADNVQRGVVVGISSVRLSIESSKENEDSGRNQRVAHAQRIQIDYAHRSGL